MSAVTASLKSPGKAQILGFVPSQNNHSCSESLTETLGKDIERAAQRRGCAVNTFDPKTLDSYGHSLDRLMEGTLSGLIWHGASRAAIPPACLLDRRLPIVLVQPPEPGLLASVNVSAGPGIAEAVEHLVSYGHREILWLGLERNGLVRHPRRREAFWRAASSFDVAGREWFVSGNWLEEPAFVEERLSRYRALLGEQLILPAFTTAVICEDDALASSLILVLKERNIRIPEDISIVGVDDLQSVGGIPSLSSVDHMLRELGSRAVDMTLRLASGRQPGLLREIIPSRLVVRDSTWRCRWSKDK